MLKNTRILEVYIDIDYLVILIIRFLRILIRSLIIYITLKILVTNINNRSFLKKRSKRAYFTREQK